MHPFPAAFLQKMESLLGQQYPSFKQELEKEPCKGLRVNTLKIDIEGFRHISPFPLEPIPWAAEGFYYEKPARPGKHPFHAAGLYYIQEPSAMAVADVLDPKPGERVLDLAAAPGGKTTHCAARMKNRGLLVANEIHPVRAKALSENVERLGVTCALVTTETPERLAGCFPAFFDRILLDAPCSGEGMFRKDEEARLAWSEKHVLRSAKLQFALLQQAARMLKPGGRLVYSTCTFSPEENERVIEQFLEQNPGWKLLPIPPRPGFEPGRPEWTATQREDLARTVRLWPHRLKGEGHFIALLQKGEESEPVNSGKRRKEDEGLWEAKTLFQQFAAEHLNLPAGSFQDGQWILLGSHLYYLPELPADAGKLRIIRAGLHLGEVKKNRFEPSHSLAMALRKEDFRHVISLPAEDPAIQAYLRGESFSVPAKEKGWTAVLVEGFPLGWGKMADGMLKNHYPKGLRIYS